MISWEEQVAGILQGEPMTEREQMLLHAAGTWYVADAIRNAMDNMAWQLNITDTLDHLRADNKRLRERLNQKEEVT